MKKYFTFIILSVSVSAFAQDFDKNMATAKASYSSGNLEDARFAMEQMLRDLDVMIGKEILKMLPAKMGTLSANVADDNVTGGTGIAGLFVHRTYGVPPKMVVIDIMNNSPLISSLNALLSMPMMGMGGDPNQKQVKVQGYKSILRKNQNTETGKTDYELQVPFNNTLLTLKADDTNEAEILNFANLIPLPKIAQVAQ